MSETEKQIVPMSRQKTLGLMAYFCVLAGLVIYLLIRAWPPETTSGSSDLVIFGLKFTVAYEVRLIIIVVLSGALGSTVHGISSLVVYKAKGMLGENWALWYFSRPFIGSPLALIMYLAVRGGLLTGFQSINVHSIAGLAGITGMFTYHATTKLRDVLDVLFGTQKEERA